MGFSPRAFQRHLALAGYETKDSALVQPSELFLTKGGDRVIDRLITFDRGNKTYALRPEFTASAALMYAEDPTQGIKRWQFSGAIFQEPTAARGGFTQRQLGAELIGWEGAAADAEIIGLAYDAVKSQDIGDIELLIGHAGLTRALLESFQIDPQIVQFLLNQRGLLAAGGLETARHKLQQFLLVDSMDTAPTAGSDEDAVATLMAITSRSSAFGGRTREEIAKRLVHKRRRGANPAAIEQALTFLDQWVKIEGAAASALDVITPYVQTQSAQEILQAWRDTLTLLTEGYSVPLERITLRPDLNRVWDYYTGVVFELRTASGIPVGGGGRYDGLIRLLSGQERDIPAIGFGLDVDVLIEQYGAEETPVDAPIFSVVGAPTQSAALAQRLRRAGFTVALNHKTNLVVEAAADGIIRFSGQRYTNPTELINALKDRIPNV